MRVVENKKVVKNFIAAEAKELFVLLYSPDALCDLCKKLTLFHACLLEIVHCMTEMLRPNTFILNFLTEAARCSAECPSPSHQTQTACERHKGVKLRWRGRSSCYHITGRRQHLIMAAGAGTFQHQHQLVVVAPVLSSYKMLRTPLVARYPLLVSINLLYSILVSVLLQARGPAPGPGWAW